MTTASVECRLCNGFGLVFPPLDHRDHRRPCVCVAPPAEPETPRVLGGFIVYLRHASVACTVEEHGEGWRAYLQPLDEGDRECGVVVLGAGDWRSQVTRHAVALRGDLLEGLL